MNRQLNLSFAFALVLLTFACTTKDIPVPKEPPPVKVDKPAEEVKETPAPPVEVEKPVTPIGDFDVSKINMADVYFDFDKSDLTPATVETLRQHVEVMKANPRLKVLVEGHCDERGTEEYNLALGERRAERIRDYCVNAGIDPSRLKTISYGELRPKANGHDEEAWSQNRRAHFKLSK